MSDFSITAIIVSGLQQLNPYTNLLTDFFIILSIFLLLLALLKRNSRVAEMAPTLLTSLGLFGFFLGLAIGLSVFDGREIENSLPRLFNGLSMAFISSIVAIFSAIVVKLIHRRKSVKSSPTNITPTDIHHVLTEISEQSTAQKTILSNMVEQTSANQQHLQKIINLQAKGFTQEVRILEELRQGLTSEDEKSLVSQMQNLRLSTEKTAQDSSQYLVQVIESPMKYFTNTIGEQLSENFKQLNLTLTALANREQSVSSIQSIEKSNTAMQEMATHIQTIPSTIQQLVQATQSLQQQLENMATHLDGFQQFGQQAGEVIPMIETNLEDLAQGMREQVKRHLELLDTSLETQLDMAESALEMQLDGFNTLQNRFGQLENGGTDKQVPMSRPNQTVATVPEESAETLVSEAPHTATLVTEQPSDSYPSVNLEEVQNNAFTFMEQGNYQQAIGYFEQALELNSTEFSLFYNKACCHALIGEAEPATVALQEAIYLNAECLEMATNDSDFDNIRYDTHFRSLLKGY